MRVCTGSRPGKRQRHKLSLSSLAPVLVDPRDAGGLLLPAGGQDALDVFLPFVARVLPDLVVPVPVAVDGERHFPGAREYLRVLERHRIVDAIRAGWRPAFHHVERVAVEAAVRVDPGFLVEIRDVDHQRVSFPASAQVKLWMGDSRGRWEGNTLVVDVTNFNEETWIDSHGSSHSDALHVLARWKPARPQRTH